MDTIEKKMSLKKRFLAFFASLAVLAGGVVAGVQADSGGMGKVIVTSDQPGAQLQIVNANGGVVAEFESTGGADTVAIPAGKGYTLHEVTPPAGYELAQDVTFEVLASETTSTQVVQPARQLPTSVSAYNDGLPTTGAYHTNDGMFVFCVDASDEYPPRGNYTAQEFNGFNGLSRDQLLRILYVGFAGNAKNYGSQFVDAEDYDAGTQFWMGTQYAVTSYTNPSLAEEYFGKYLGPNKRLANQIRAAANDTSIVVPEGSIAYLYQSYGNQPFVAASFPVVQQETNYGGPTQVSINHVKKTTPPPPTPGDGKVVIKKTDDAGNVLKGAKFKIVNAAGQTVQEFTSTGNDEFTLAPGTYTLIETKAPKGYEIQGEGKYPFEIKAGTIGAVTPGQTTSVVGAPTVGTIIAGTGSMEIAGGSALAFCVNPQAKFLWETGSTYSYSVVGEGQVNLNAFGTKNPAGARGWVNAVPSNVGLTAAKMEQVKKVLWATYDFVMTGSASKDYTGIISDTLGQATYKQAGVYQAAQVAIAEIVSPGSVNWNALGNNHTTGNVKALALALVGAAQGQASYASYFFAYGGFSIVYLQSSDPSTQNLVTPGSEEVEVVVVNTKEEEIEENPNSDSYFPTLNIEAKKSLDGGDINSAEYKNAFEFTLTGSNGAPMPATTTVKNNGEKVSFGAVEFTRAGKFTYTIKEKVGSLDGVTYDRSSKTVEVTVAQQKFGNDTYLVISEVKVDGNRVNADVSYGNFPPLPNAPQNVYGQSNSNYGSYYGSSFFIQSGGTTHTAFCLDFSKDYPRNANYSLIANPSDIERKADMLKKIAYFGYPYDGSGQLASYVRQVNNTGLSDEVVFRYATNVAIWKTLGQSLPSGSDAFSVAVHSIANKIINTANANSIPSNVQVAMHVYSSGYSSLQRLITFDAVKKPQHVKVTVATSFKNTIKPEIGTTATDNADGDHAVIAGRVKIIDRVHYKRLVPGKEYTVTGTLHVRDANGKDAGALNVEGATVSKKFTASATGEGDVYMEFSIDASALAGDTLVAFEEVKDNGKTVAVHADITDEGQSVKVKDNPEIGTLATVGGKKIVEAKGKVTITDLVGYKNLQAGKTYTLKGQLVKKSDGTVLAENSTTFAAVEGDGTVTLDFVIADASVLKGESVVVFEEVFDGDRAVAAHTDIADEKQTVTFPEIGTTATEGGDHYAAPTGKVTIVDEVKYTNLIVGKTYTVEGTLYDKATGKALTVAGATASKTFKADKANGSVKLEFTIDASALAGKAVVAFETVSHEGVVVAVHADITDEDQTVYIPEIGTTATDAETEDHVGMAAENTTLVDVVAYKGLKPGETYTVKGQLMKRADSSVIEGATAEATFVASATGEGTVELTFTYDATKLAGFASVAFEELYDVNGALVAEHKDIKDEGQTVYYPEVKTNASDKEDGDQILAPEKTVTVVDKVTYKNLIPGKEYTVSGVLMDKDTNAPLVVDGKEVTASKTFTPKEKTGSVELEFTFKASALNGKTLVVFETVLYKGKEVAVHADIEDEDQTVKISEKPEIGTTLTYGESGKEVESNGPVEVVDTVAYSNLKGGKTYTLKGTLVKKSDESVVATGEATFTADASGTGTTTMTFTFDASKLRGESVVAYEYLFIGDVTGTDVDEWSDEYVTKHEDINDGGQTVYVREKPEIEKYVNQNVHKEIDLSEVFTYDVLAYITKDADRAVITDTLNDDLQFVSAVEDVTVVDLGTENNHKPYGTVAEDGPAVVTATVAINGQTLTVNIDPANDYRGHWVKVTFDAKIKDGKKLEDLKYVTITENTPVITDEQHEGVPNDASYKIWVGNEGKYEDESNTVTVKPTEIGTLATVKNTDGEKVVFNDSEVTVVDAVLYKGLEPGKEYTVKGKLVTKSSGGATVVATGEKTFTASATGKGVVTMEFTFDASQLGGDSVVAFEYLYRDNKFVTKHEDIDDEGQTVEVKKPEVETTASDAADGDKYIDIAADVKINDVVTFTNLIPGKEYTLDGTLHVKNDEQTPVDARSVKAVAAEGATIVDADARTFVADAANGFVTLEFTVDGTQVAGEQVVVFESLKYLGKEIAAHADINDTAQTVYFPEVGTTATVDGAKEVTLRYLDEAVVTVTDEIAYSGFEPGKTFTVKGKLVSKLDETYIVVESAATFTTSDAGEGVWPLEFTFNTADLPREHAQLVVFEYVFEGDVLDKNIDLDKAEEDDSFVAKHADIDDEGQTVTLTRTYPTAVLLGTTATDAEDNDKVLEANSDARVKDVVQFSGLTIGRTYTLKAKLVVKGTNGKTVVAEAEKSFIPDVEDGTTDMIFEFNTAGLEGESLVAYEYLFEGDVVGQDVDLDSLPDDLKHADDNDEGQTVTVKKDKETPPPTPPVKRKKVRLPVTGLPKTGETAALAIGMAALLIGGGVLLLRRRND